MTKTELEAAIVATKTETKEALQIIYDSLNQGQQKKLLKNDEIKSLFIFYGVSTDAE